MLVIVGVLMFADIRKIDFTDISTAIPAFFIIIFMPLTFSITRGLAAGFISHVFVKIVTGRFRELNPVVVVLAIVSAVAFIID